MTRLTAFNLNNIFMRKISIIFCIIGLSFAAYYFFSSGAESTERVVLLPRNPATTALPDNLAATTSALPAVATTSETSLEEKIKALEASGALPKLDRSTSIKGPDQDLNGVRDDIDAWIAALPITELQKKAATQAAIGMQNTLLVDTADNAAMEASGNETMASSNCIADVFMPNYNDGFKLRAKIEAMTANTKERTYQYIKYNRAASGSVTSLPNGNTCK
jgi:hypothetical protein